MSHPLPPAPAVNPEGRRFSYFEADSALSSGNERPAARGSMGIANWSRLIRKDIGRLDNKISISAVALVTANQGETRVILTPVADAFKREVYSPERSSPRKRLCHL